MIRKWVAFILMLSSMQGIRLQAGALEDLENAFLQTASKISPSVVSISTLQIYRVQSGYRVEPFASQDKAWNEFVQRYFLAPQETELHRLGLGSGIIVKSDGYILTNYHMVQGASGIEVTLQDGRKFPAQVLGKDSRSDLAMVKINAENLPSAELGDSSQSKAGQWVMALGNPFGYLLKDNQATLTVGVISATHRRLIDLGFGAGPYYFDLIQTDAAINPGNSGGPLVNLKGQVIGINVAMFSASGSFSGIGFAIPSNVAKNVLNTLMEGEEVVYGWLGVGVAPVDQRMVKDLRLPDAEGVLILKIFEASPAEKSKLKEMDVIRKINLRPVKSSEDLIQEVASLRAGASIQLEVFREGQKMDIEVLLEAHPNEKI
jgi:serine protease Do